MSRQGYFQGQMSANPANVLDESFERTSEIRVDVDVRYTGATGNCLSYMQISYGSGRANLSYIADLCSCSFSVVAKNVKLDVFSRLGSGSTYPVLAVNAVTAPGHVNNALEYTAGRYWYNALPGPQIIPKRAKYIRVVPCGETGFQGFSAPRNARIIIADMTPLTAGCGVIDVQDAIERPMLLPRYSIGGDVTNPITPWHWQMMIGDAGEVSAFMVKFILE